MRAKPKYHLIEIEICYSLSIEEDIYHRAVDGKIKREKYMVSGNMKFISSDDQDISRASEANGDISLSTRGKNLIFPSIRVLFHLLYTKNCPITLKNSIKPQ